MDYKRKRKQKIFLLFYVTFMNQYNKEKIIIFTASKKVCQWLIKYSILWPIPNCLNHIWNCSYHKTWRDQSRLFLILKEFEKSGQKICKITNGQKFMLNQQFLVQTFCFFLVSLSLSDCIITNVKVWQSRILVHGWADIGSFKASNVFKFLSSVIKVHFLHGWFLWQQLFSRILNSVLGTRVYIEEQNFVMFFTNLFDSKWYAVNDRFK